MDKERERGMVSAELAMTMPVVLGVLFLLFSAGAALVTQIRVSDAAREAARGYAMEVDEAQIRSLVTDRAGDDAQLSVTRSGTTITVTVSADMTGAFSLLDLTASSTMTALVEPSRP